MTLAGESAHTFGSSKLASLLQTMFEPVVTRFETHILRCSAVGSGGATTSSAAGGGELADGIEAVAMLTVLHEFSLMYASISPMLFENTSTSSSVSAAVPEKRHTMISFEDSNENITVPSAESAAATAAPAVSYYLMQVLDTLRNALLARLHQFVNEQIVWINAQKYDPKSPAVLAPFAKFPTLIVQVMEMTNGMVSLLK